MGSKLRGHSVSRCLASIGWHAAAVIGGALGIPILGAREAQGISAAAVKQLAVDIVKELILAGPSSAAERIERIASIRHTKSKIQV